MEKISLTITPILISILLMACGGEERSSDSQTIDLDQQSEENTGVPLDPIERSRDTDTVDQQKVDNTGVPLDNLERSQGNDTAARPLNTD